MRSICHDVSLLVLDAALLHLVTDCHALALSRASSLFAQGSLLHLASFSLLTSSRMVQCILKSDLKRVYSSLIHTHTHNVLAETHISKSPFAFESQLSNVSAKLGTS